MTFRLVYVVSGFGVVPANKGGSGNMIKKERRARSKWNIDSVANAFRRGR